MHGMIAVLSGSPVLVALLARPVHAGFPSPADDHAEQVVDLAALLVPRPASTFLVWVRGDSLSGLGVRDGDLAVVDRSLEPRPGDVVMVDVDGERAFKVWEVAPDGAVVLASANPRYPSVRVGEGASVEVWGVMSGSARPRRTHDAPDQEAGAPDRPGLLIVGTAARAREAAPRAYALSDRNSFYCSCERLFDPALKVRPVIVLSNNDGCAVARTAEAKALGIAMRAPWFKVKDMCRRQGVRVFSSNYALYGDISSRVNAVYERFSPRIEVYSIDESFLDLTDVRPHEREALARDMRSTVLRWTGIPTCVGIGPTKTLAKLANAKKVPELGGVLDLTLPGAADHWFVRVPPEDVWGVGRASAAKLAALGCESVADVRDLDPREARRLFTVVGERLVHELRGTPCLDLETVAPTKKGCAVTRMFASRVTDQGTLEQAVAAHAARLGEKLRREGLGTTHVTVFFHTSAHDDFRPQRSVSLTAHLPEATSDTLALVSAAVGLVRQSWKPGYRYAKAGVVTVDLVALDASQRAMSGLGRMDREKGAALMGALDACTRRFGRGAVVPGAAGFADRRGWATKFEMRSPRYTTRVRELPVVVAA